MDRRWKASVEFVGVSSSDGFLFEQVLSQILLPRFIGGIFFLFINFIVKRVIKLLVQVNLRLTEKVRSFVFFAFDSKF